jgi:hypothetical protein
MADRARPQTLEVAHPNAAGIDIASGSHFVAVRADLHEQPVREFGSLRKIWRPSRGMVDRVRGGRRGDGIDRRLLDPAV